MAHGIFLSLKSMGWTNCGGRTTFYRILRSGNHAACVNMRVHDRRASGRRQGRKTAGIHARGRGDIAIAAWIQAAEGMKRAIAAPSKPGGLLDAIE
jgi:hypothetical protein